MAQGADLNFGVVSAESVIRITAVSSSVVLLDEQREAMGTLRARVTQSAATVEAIQITAMDLSVEDISVSDPLDATLENFRIVLGAGRGTAGPEVAVVDGAFSVMGTEVELEGTISVEGMIGPFPVSGSEDLSALGPVGLDFAGTIAATPSGLEITFPVEINKTIDLGLGIFDPVVTISGTIVARQLPPVEAMGLSLR
jgi:hypothetical protein